MNEFQQEVVDLLINKARQIFPAYAGELSKDTSFKEDLGAKSVNIVQFASALEDEYEVEVPYMQLNKCVTFGDAAKFVDDALSM